MKNLILCAFFITSIFAASAQSGRNVERGLLKVNALLPGASYELGVGRNATFNFDVSLFPVAEDNSSIYYDRIDFDIFPSIGADFRYFVNMKRRLRKGKDITRNSGNYVAFENQLVIGTPFLGTIETENPFGYNTSVVYGIQRTYGKGFYWGLSFGPSVFIFDESYNGTVAVNGKIGWVIKRRN